MGDVKLPAIGPVDSKWVYAGGALVAGIVGYAYLHRGSSAPVADQTDAAADWSGEGVDSGGAWTSAPPGGTSVITTPQDPADLPPTTNDDWTRRAVAGLNGLGWDAQLVATVLGKYLGRQQVTPAEAVIITAAKAYQGDPPQGTYSIILLPAGTAPATTPPATGQRMHMVWVSSKVAVGGETLTAKQTRLAHTASAAGVWKPSSASLKAVIAQAGIRSGISPNAKLSVGRTVSLYTAVPY